MIYEYTASVRSISNIGMLPHVENSITSETLDNCVGYEIFLFTSLSKRYSYEKVTSFSSSKTAYFT